MALEGVELRSPEVPIATQPPVELGETVGPQRVHAPLRVGPDLDQPRLAEDAEMAGHGRLRQIGQDLGQVARRALTVGEEIEELAAARIGDGGEDVHVCNIALI